MEQQKAPLYILVNNDIAELCPTPPGAFLEQAPRGSYTTARTLHNCTAVYELSFHIHRLASSARMMLDSDVAEGRPGAEGARKINADAVSDEALRPVVLNSLQKAVQAYRMHSDNEYEELKLTVLVTWAAQDHSLQVFTHASAMASEPEPPIKVEIRGAPRHNALAKDSDWVRQRKIYEKEKAAGVEEVLMVDAHTGGVLEGLSSNFFVVTSDGKLQTAGEGVLFGSIREAVLRAADKLGIEVELQAPLLDDLEQWQAAFISSTSRLLLPIDEISVPGGHPRVKMFEKTPLVQKLVAAVNLDIASHSEPLYS